MHASMGERSHNRNCTLITKGAADPSADIRACSNRHHMDKRMRSTADSDN